MKKKALLLAGIISAGLAMGSLSVYASEEIDPAVLEEGYTETGDGWTSTVTWTENDGMKIYGEFYYPEDYDASKNYPVVIMSHGFNATHTNQFEVAEWPQLMANEGYISYIFDFCGGSKKSRSDGEFTKMSVMTEVDDLKAVIDFVKSQSFTNQDEIFLMGSSQGGLVSALTAAERDEDVKGMILMYPGFIIPQNIRDTYPVFDEIPEDKVQVLGSELEPQYVLDIYDLNVMEAISGFTGDVLIIHGMGDVLVPYTDSVVAMESAYADSYSELLLLTGEETEHGFDTLHESTRAKAHEAAINYMDRQIAE